MSDQPELALCVEGGDLPAELFARPAAYMPEWGAWERRSCELDAAYPEERIEVTPRSWIYLRGIEDGIWLWGASWWNGKSGGGFGPLRKWGAEHAATSRERALSAARIYVAERMR